MANTITGFTTFVTKTVISSSDMNTNLQGLKDYSPVWHKYSIAYTDVNAATATNDYVLVTLSSDEIVNAVYMKHSTAWIGGSISQINAQVGTSASVNRYTGPFNCFAAVSDGAYDLNSVLLKENTATSLIITFSATGANLDSLTAGNIDVWVQKSALPSS